MSGKDAVKLLQGLISNDVSKLGNVGSSAERLLYAAMLKADVSSRVRP